MGRACLLGQCGGGKERKAAAPAWGAAHAEREGVGSWAALVGAGPRGRGLRTGLGQQERGSGFGFGFSPHGLGCFGFWVS